MKIYKNPKVETLRRYHFHMNYIIHELNKGAGGLMGRVLSLQSERLWV